MQLDQFIAACESFSPVPRETVNKLEAYANLLLKWQEKVNLVSASTLPDLWRRHFLDSAQLIKYLGNAESLVDFGAGAGFPAMVLAIMTNAKVTAIESDSRKCAFMTEVARATETQLTILNQRIEAVTPLPAAFITARAFASLTDILALAEPWLAQGSELLLLKGADFTVELTAADSLWHIQYQQHQSLTDDKAKVVHINKVARRDTARN